MLLQIYLIMVQEEKNLVIFRNVCNTSHGETVLHTGIILCEKGITWLGSVHAFKSCYHFCIRTNTSQFVSSCVISGYRSRQIGEKWTVRK